MPMTASQQKLFIGSVQIFQLQKVQQMQLLKPCSDSKLTGWWTDPAAGRDDTSVQKQCAFGPLLQAAMTTIHAAPT